MSFANVENTSFVFEAVDSRGYTTTKTVYPTVMVAYIPLTCNPKVLRPTPTGSTISVQASGNYFRGSFGLYSNTLTLQYRYKESGGSYCSWKTIPSTNISVGASNYQTDGAIILDEEFDYQKSYVFQIRAIDGIEGYQLTSVTKSVTVQRGIPVFDWGENDFNVNGDLRMSDVSILDIIYPVGSVYISTSSTMPTALAIGGMLWETSTKVGDMYCWKRIS